MVMMETQKYSNIPTIQVSRPNEEKNNNDNMWMRAEERR
jgi:hypothetical protein